MNDVVTLLRQRLKREPDRLALLDRARVLVTDDMLEEIARSDYGHDVSLHLEAFRRIRDGAVPFRLEGQPREVLELNRWSQPEQERGHRMRLFSCATLLAADAHPQGAEHPTLAALIDSLFELRDESLIHAAQDHLLFRLSKGLGDEEDRAFFALGLLFLLLELRPAALRAEDWQALGTWVIEEEAAARTGAGPWLLGEADVQHVALRRLGERALRMPPIEGLELVFAGLSEWRSAPGK